MRIVRSWLVLVLVLTLVPAARAADAVIKVDAGQRQHNVSRYLTGACIEDVNHEIYGGFYSQMIFGESFQEPAPASPIEGFSAYGGEWSLTDGVLSVNEGEGHKLILDELTPNDAFVSVKVQFEDRAGGNAGLVLRASKLGEGANQFFGYEVSLDPAAQILRLGRHRNDWQLIRDVPCEVPTQEWIELNVSLDGNRLEIFVDDERKLIFRDNDNAGLEAGQVGLRQWQRNARFQSLSIATESAVDVLNFTQAQTAQSNAVSGMWRPVVDEQATAEFRLVDENPFVGTQSQQIRFVDGDGVVGIEHQGLNRWGLHFLGEKTYEGVLYARAQSPCQIRIAAENADGNLVADEKTLQVTSQDWQRLEFTLTPRQTVDRGRFAITLNRPGTVDLGYVFLQPGAWGRYEDLPVRGDVAQQLIDQGITILRYGGSMVNNDRYRWKKMIGPRAERSPYRGHWYPYSTNGWGILDFMDFCEAAGFEYVPTFSMSESPEDMADFVRYTKGDVETEWGARRAANGHPVPYRLKYLQLGNEERVDEDYARRFAERAEAIWAVDPQVHLIVGDFVYDDPITDPQNVTGAASGITNLNGQQQILQFAKEHDQEIWFDVHVWTGGPRPNQSFDAMFTFIDALEQLADGAKFRVLTFEFNANNHSQRRAVANALAINAIERDGRLPIATSANCLQPVGQNDNGWDQGLLFLSPSEVWLQPPGYVTQMYAQTYQPHVVSCKVESEGDAIDCTAKLSPDGSTLVLHVVNLSEESQAVTISLTGFQPRNKNATVMELSGDLDATNTEEKQDRVVPQYRDWKPTFEDNQTEFNFRPHSVTTIELK